MCGRFTLSYPDAESLAAALGAIVDPADAAIYVPHYNAAPSTAHLVVRATKRGARELVAATWGLANAWATEARIAPPINARAESVRKKPWFRDAFARRRCVVPATGFFEW